MRIAGIDYGGARIGVALGDTETRIASPWSVLANRDETTVMAELKKLIEEEDVATFVVGVPRPLSDQSRETGQAREIRSFAERLKSLGKPVIEENETWSSAQAQAYMRERGERGKRDDLAATVILQTWLDRKKGEDEESSEDQE